MVYFPACGTSPIAGFVSFDNGASATNAITGMHGYNLNGYVLKVSLKKNSPY